MSSMSEYARGVLDEDALIKLNEQMAGVLAGLCVGRDSVELDSAREYLQQLIDDEVRHWDDHLLLEFGKELVAWGFDSGKNKFMFKIIDV